MVLAHVRRGVLDHVPDRLPSIRAAYRGAQTLVPQAGFSGLYHERGAALFHDGQSRFLGSIPDVDLPVCFVVVFPHSRTLDGAERRGARSGGRVSPVYSYAGRMAGFCIGDGVPGIPEDAAGTREMAEIPRDRLLISGGELAQYAAGVLTSGKSDDLASLEPLYIVASQAEIKYGQK